MVDREDWVDWDNSMKAHIDQIEVKFKTDLVMALEKAGKINEIQSTINEALVRETQKTARKHERTRIMITVCYVLIIVNLVAGIIAFQGVYGP